MTMKLFKFTCGADERVGVFVDAAEANERRAEIDPTFQYVYTTIEELHIPGYSILITPSSPIGQPPKTLEEIKAEINAMEAPLLKTWLTDRKVEYVKQWGEAKLREAALAWLAEQSVETN